MECMLRQEFLPAVHQYTHQLVEAIQGKKAVLDSPCCTGEEQALTHINTLTQCIYTGLQQLAEHIAKAEQIQEELPQATYYQEVILQDMAALRQVADQAEAVLPRQYLPYPDYAALLFSV